MSFCPSCGYKIEDDEVVYCPKCGYKVSSDSKEKIKSLFGDFVEVAKGTIGEERTEEYKGSIDKFQKNINNRYYGFRSNVAVNVLPVNLVETEDYYYLQANVAGVEKEQISIEMTDNTISIEVESNDVLSNIENYDEKSSILIQNEFKNNDKERIFQLEECILKDEIETKQENGVLLITIPKKEISDNFVDKISEHEKGKTKEAIENVSKKVGDTGKNIKTKFTDEKTSVEETDVENQNERINEIDPISQLKEAKELLDLGVITEDEFVAMKQNIINK